MKAISLKEATKSLQVMLNDNGFELHSPAGTACYDAWGVRCNVNGIPEYFPVSLTVKDVRTKAENVASKGAITVKLELDIGDCVEQLREFTENEVSEQIKSMLKPGGLLWGR